MSLNAAIAIFLLILLVFSAIVAASVKSFATSVNLNDATWPVTDLDYLVPRPAGSFISKLKSERKT